MKKFVILFGLMSAIWVSLFAQTDQYKFKHLTINQGLSHNQVNAIFKDRKGFLWVGTNAGLNRYDGNKVKIFKNDSRDSTSLFDNAIYGIFEAPDETLVITTGSGIALYQSGTETFTRNTTAFFRKYNLYEGGIIAIRKDAKGDFWFVQSQGITCFQSSSQRAIRIVDQRQERSGIDNVPVTYFAIDQDDTYWIFYADGLLEKVRLHENKTVVIVRNPYLKEKNKGNRYDYRGLADSDGDLWLFANNDNQGVYYYNTKTGSFNHYTTASNGIKLNTNIVGGFVEDKKGQIWVGTDHGGINVIDKKNNAVFFIYHREEDSFTPGQNTITTLYKDDTGIIWIGTYKRGVSYYHENIFRFDVYRSYPNDPYALPYSDVNRFVEDDKGNLWIGTNGGGLIYFDRAKGTFRQFKHDPNDPNSLSSNVIVSLCFDHEKKLWIGTYYGGLNLYDGKKFVRYKHDPADERSLSGRNVWEIFEDSRNNLWIGTLEGGLNLFDRKQNSFVRFHTYGPNAIQSNYISAIMEDSQGDIWFGTSSGIDVYAPDRKTFRHYANNPEDPTSLGNNNIFDIVEDQKGRIWIATQEGLSIYSRSGDNFTIIKEKDGLPHNNILTVQVDQQGHVWLGTPNGLTRMSETESGWNFNNYTEFDGLQSLQFNENASYKTRDGELVFGGPSGFNVFHPENLGETGMTNTVVFTDFQLFQKSVGIGEKIDGNVILNKSVTETTKVVLLPGQNFFSIEFSALNFIHPEKNEYLYKLEGLNDEWLPVDRNTRKVTFTNLSPRDYTLKVKASTIDGDWPEEYTQLAITVLPPFWRTNLAFIFYFLFIAGILYLARKLIQQREKLKFAIEQERQEALRMHELDMMKIKFFTNVSHEFRTPLTLILTPLEKMLRQASEPDQRNQYQLIQRNAKRLLTLVNQLLDFRKMEVQELRYSPSEGDIMKFIRDTVYSFSDLSEKKGIHLTFDSSIDRLETLFDQDKLEKILFNLLSNAFKFTPEKGEVAVEVTAEQTNGSNWLIISVRDTGIGIPSDKLDKVFERFFQNDLPRSMVNQGSGIGLSITKEFVRIHGGQILVESEPGKGSCFIVRIPIHEIKDQLHSAPNVISPAEPLSSGTEEGIVMAQRNGNGNMPSLLLVEDNVDFRFYLKDNLKQTYQVFEAANGEEGWRQTLSIQPDLIVSDVMMPLMNGIDLCRKIKADERVSHIPVILLTARTSEDQRLEGYETGADDYITKPFNFEILESRIKNLIALRERSHKNFRKTLDVQASELNITPLDTKFIENAIKCVETNVSSPDFSVEDLGRELGISRAYLYKKIVALTGKSPLEFIRTIRLQHAAQLLEKSQMTVAEVAYKVGFNNPKYFARYFKEEYNILPSGYAAMKRKERGS